MSYETFLWGKPVLATRKRCQTVALLQTCRCQTNGFRLLRNRFFAQILGHETAGPTALVTCLIREVWAQCPPSGFEIVQIHLEYQQQKTWRVTHSSNTIGRFSFEGFATTSQETRNTTVPRLLPDSCRKIKQVTARTEIHTL